MNSVERVKNLCKERDIPISRLERDLGFANGYIAGLRGGNMPAGRLKKIANYMGVSLDYLISGEAEEGWYLTRETAEIAQELFMNSELRLLFSAARDLTPEQLKLLQQMAKSWETQK